MYPTAFENITLKNRYTFQPVVKFDPKKEKLLALDFTEKNTALTADIIENTAKFTEYIQRQLQAADCKFGIGGYAENRTVYSRSRVFDAQKPGDEPRRLHLGTDIWGPAGTPVYAFIGGRVHSFGYNNRFGDYGATLILLHQLDGVAFHTLYGHLSLKDIQTITAGQYMTIGQQIGSFGEPIDNGHWPPHLHFQVILDMELKVGDYPGVCKYSERKKYLENCPDPDSILQLNKYIVNRES
jgi:murein DD-endopeptidase MepM/ murein hydrolase activator NlpD